MGNNRKVYNVSAVILLTALAVIGGSLDEMDSVETARGIKCGGNISAPTGTVTILFTDTTTAKKGLKINPSGATTTTPNLLMALDTGDSTVKLTDPNDLIDYYDTLVTGLGVAGYFSLWDGTRHQTYGNMSQDEYGNIKIAFVGERSVEIESSNDNAHLYLSADAENTATTISQDPRMFFQSANATRACIYFDEDAGYLKLASNYNTSEVSINMGTGYVGIGTANPGEILDLDNGAKGIQFGLESYGSKIVSWSKTASTWNDLDIRATNGTGSGIYLKTSGNVGVGTDSPDDELDIESSAPTIRLTDSDGGYARMYNNDGSIYLHADPGNTQSTSGIYFSVDGFPPMAIFDYNQRLGLGTNAPDERLHVNGNIKATGTIYGDSLNGTKMGSDGAAACSLFNGATYLSSSTAYWHRVGKKFSIDIPELSGTVTSGNTTIIKFAAGTLPNPPITTINKTIWISEEGSDAVRCCTYGGSSQLWIVAGPSLSGLGDLSPLTIKPFSFEYVTN